MPYDAPQWQNFYVMTGGAAAALTGLLFVSMSLHSNEIMRNPFYRNRAVGTLMSLTTQLLLSAAVLVPAQPLALLGVEVVAAAVFWMLVTVRAIFWRGPSTGSAPMSLFRRLAELVGGLTWLALFLAAGLSFIIRFGGGFYLLALVMIFAFGWNVYVAWVLLTEISE